MKTHVIVGKVQRAMLDRIFTALDLARRPKALVLSRETMMAIDKLNGGNWDGISVLPAFTVEDVPFVIDNAKAFGVVEVLVYAGGR